MPVNIASGAVELEFVDVAIPGQVALVWERHYSTERLDRAPTPLGQGWTNSYCATLEPKFDGFEFVTPEGASEFVEDRAGLVRRGGRAVNLGAGLEVFRDGRRYLVQHWEVESGAVRRYAFIPDETRRPWRLASLEDVTGQALDLEWDAAGKLISVTQRLERRCLRLAYTRHGTVGQVLFQPPDGEHQLLARYEYDPQGRLSAAYDAAGFADRYEYDEKGRITREIVKDGGVFTFRYDAQGRCIRTSGLGRYDEKRLRFLDAVGITEVTDSYDNTRTYQYLPSGQMVREVDPLGGETKTDYDEHGRIVAKTDPTGAVTRYGYDEKGNRNAITDALGHTYSFVFNDHHLPVAMTDPNGQVWRRTYDGANRLVATEDPLGHRWTIGYDAEGNAAELRNPLGARAYRKFTRGVLEAVTDWMGHSTSFRLDGFGRVSERIGPLGEVTRFRYDTLGNPIEVRLPDGSGWRAAYDSAGNLTHFIDGNGHITRFRYGPCRRLLARIDPVGGTVRYVWGSEPGWLEQVVNEKEETYTFFRDAAGRIVRERGFDGAERQFGYDAAGFTRSYTNANGETIHIQRDALHRIIRQILPDGGEVNYGFDPLGNLVSAVNADIAVRFERDPLGRIIKEFQGEHWVESRYDAVGNLIRTATSLGHEVDYRVDANGLVSQLATLGQTLEFRRNAYGQETARQMPGGMLMEQSYDDLGRLVEQRVGPGWLSDVNEFFSAIPENREIIHRRYAYDRNSALTAIVDGRWGRVDYFYDPAERLLQALRERGTSEAFEYDACGNITRMRSENGEATDETLVYGPGNRLVQKGTTRYEYDAEGRRINKIEEADSAEPKVWRYQWDALDRLRSVTRPDGEVWRYKYDAFARRVEKAGPETVRQFLWDGDVLVQEHAKDQSLAAWLFEADSFAPLATVQNGQVYSVINDHLGTPKELVDTRGAVAWSSLLKAWGEEDTGTGHQALPSCPIRFQGQYRDEETDLHYNRFRYYDPESGQYLSPDPIGLAGGLRTHGYVHDPVGWVDPTGLDLIRVAPNDPIVAAALRGYVNPNVLKIQRPDLDQALIKSGKSVEFPYGRADSFGRNIAVVEHGDIYYGFVSSKDGHAEARAIEWLAGRFPSRFFSVLSPCVSKAQCLEKIQKTYGPQFEVLYAVEHEETGRQTREWVTKQLHCGE
ncbi:RHS repeat-associated core domain-containing protein [Candidatus Methylocalor cossyra]|uniref:Type IV secretion protein Rhs n=1 Tax=Candidatus Methylocalor cossyra TaxID=3108543 RepID=A0ABM9NMU2_9GAMM